MPQSSKPFPLRAALASKCPRCGQGKLFAGFLELAPRCNSCGLDYSFADSGDGPAVFVMLLAGFVIVGLALWVEVTYEPPFWVHLVIFFPLTLIVCLGMLRPFKSFMVAAQFHHKAAEGRLKE
ncbi:DUF983 domain-containing protein [Rhodoblastus sp.]|uniref:DUF983 domain-containing protein n=1 Tax=Rhodoblastus sp. TaxID=1962975 RepID=UPI002618CDE9|nr:DUF983 domain-containing protein [Rhodoblastus sp.]